MFIFLLLGLLLLLVVMVLDKNNGGDSTTHVMMRVELSEEDQVWVDEPTYHDIMDDWHCMSPGVMDVTHLEQPMTVYNHYRTLSESVPQEPSRHVAVSVVLNSMRTSRMNDRLTALSAFRTRHTFSVDGMAAVAYIEQQLNSDIQTTASTGRASVRRFSHKYGGMPSLIARIGTQHKDVVIACAHMDSINHKVPAKSDKALAKAPGADDNASGVAGVMECFSAWLQSGHVPEIGVEFHFYSGEELGLKGSLEVAESYRLAGTVVKGVYNSDMTGFPNVDMKAYFVDGPKDQVDRALTQFAMRCAAKYTKLVPVSGSCGYGCSDFASWYRFGYAAVCASEGLPNAPTSMTPYIHTDKDTMKGLSLAYMAEHAKSIAAFLVEMASS